MNYTIKKIKRKKKTLWLVIRPDGNPAQPEFHTKQEAENVRNNLQQHWYKYWQLEFTELPDTGEEL